MPPDFDPHYTRPDLAAVGSLELDMGHDGRSNQVNTQAENGELRTLIAMQLYKDVPALQTGARCGNADQEPGLATGPLILICHRLSQLPVHQERLKPSDT